jgi:hypothetical protein
MAQARLAEERLRRREDTETPLGPTKWEPEGGLGALLIAALALATGVSYSGVVSGAEPATAYRAASLPFLHVLHKVLVGHTAAVLVH